PGPRRGRPARRRRGRAARCDPRPGAGRSGVGRSGVGRSGAVRAGRRSGIRGSSRRRRRGRDRTARDPGHRPSGPAEGAARPAGRRRSAPRRPTGADPGRRGRSAARGALRPHPCRTPPGRAARTPRRRPRPARRRRPGRLRRPVGGAAGVAAGGAPGRQGDRRDRCGRHPVGHRGGRCPGARRRPRRARRSDLVAGRSRGAPRRRGRLPPPGPGPAHRRAPARPARRGARRGRSRLVGWRSVADTSASSSQTGTGPVPRIGAAATAKPFRNPGAAKHIFVTGGVVSSLGKGLTAASLGMLLRSRGLRVTMQKLDPYLNVDPGTMNPFQHGEVFVTEDGAETDLDIGHYERFLDEDLTAAANVTTGQVYSTVIAKERRGEYLGDTVQVIPHITDAIKQSMRSQAHDDVDVVITEIGGTVGDIESQPFLEAARQVRQDIGRENVFFVHVCLVPLAGPCPELKTIPTQRSVAALRSIGIQPAARVLRAARELPASVKAKISSMCDVDPDAVVTCADAPSIYEIPLVLHGEGLDAYAIRRLDLLSHDVDWTQWEELLRRVHDPAYEVTVALVGKYIDLPDAYLSVTEALRAGGFHHRAEVVLRWVEADLCASPEGAAEQLRDVD